MWKDVQIAWRNLWRNRKRTTITISAIIFAVVISSFSSSMQEGTYARMIDNIVKFYSGYIQIHLPGYWESKSINDTFKSDSLLERAILTTPQITFSTQRLESFSLVSSGENTRGCALIGINPLKEDSLTNLSRWINKGKYLSPGDKGIILAVNLARNLGVSVGDTLILLSQGYHGASASALMPLRGILKFSSPQLNNFGAYIDLEQARDFFGAPGRSTSLVLMVSDYRQVAQAAKALGQKVEPAYSVKTWDELQPDLVNMITGDRAGAVIMKAILYLVVGFGILGTIIMMMAERRKEMGVMIAIGIQKYRLQRIISLESLFIGLIGVIAGVAISMPIITSLVSHPIPLPGESAKIYESFGIEAVFYFSSIPKVFVNQAITVFILSLIIALYPVFTIRNLNIINALRAH